MGKHATILTSGACAASIDFDGALAILAAHARPLGKESVALADAGGRHLAAPVLARIDAPRRDCAAMDGYAVRDADLKNGTIFLRSRGTSYAGGAKPGAISAGETWRVMTGAPLPHGSDRVVMIEHCRHRGELVADGPSSKFHTDKRRAIMAFSMARFGVRSCEMPRTIRNKTP